MATQVYLPKPTPLGHAFGQDWREREDRIEKRSVERAKEGVGIDHGSHLNAAFHAPQSQHISQ